MLMYQRITHLIYLMLCCCILNGCFFRSQDDVSQNEPPLNLQAITIHLDDDANLDSATSIDIVVVNKSELLQKLMQMSAVEFNEKIDQLRRDYPKMMTIHHWELTPGQTLSNLDIQVCCKDNGAVVFANYFTPGDHRIRIGDAKHIHLELKKNDFCIVEQGCNDIINIGKNTRAAVNDYIVKTPMLNSQINHQANLDLYNVSTPVNQAPITPHPMLANKPDVTINDVHQNVTEMKKTIDATQSLVKQLPLR